MWCFSKIWAHGYGQFPVTSHSRIQRILLNIHCVSGTILDAGDKVN